MVYLLELREKIREIYSNNKEYCRLLYKFLMSFIVFFCISATLNFDTGFLNIIAVLLLSVMGAFLPNAITVLLAAVVSVICVTQYSVIVGIIVFFLLLIIYCLFMRFTPKYGYVMLAMPVAFLLNMPCFIPIVVGLFFTPVVTVAVACGTIIFYLFESIKSVENVSNSINKEEAMQIFIYVMREFTENKAMIFSIVITVIITIVVYIIRTRNISYPAEISIVVAGLVYILSALFCNLGFDFELSVFSIIMGTLAACVLAYIVQFFKVVLDYSSIENVQFEDDDYVYYVKAVPKVKISTQKNDIKKITVQKPNLNNDGFDDDFDFDKIGKESASNKKDEELGDTITDLNLDDVDNKDND